MPPRQPEPVITGYANIHRYKKGMPLEGDSRLRLNKIVQEARNYVETETDDHNSDLFERNHLRGRGTPYTEMNYSENNLLMEPLSREKSYSEYGNYTDRHGLRVSQNGQ